MYICISIYIYLHIYRCISVYIYIYTHTHTNKYSKIQKDPKAETLLVPRILEQGYSTCTTEKPSTHTVILQVLLAAVLKVWCLFQHRPPENRKFPGFNPDLCKMPRQGHHSRQCWGSLSFRVNLRTMRGGQERVARPTWPISATLP
jgi:hypothetical protein